MPTPSEGNGWCFRSAMRRDCGRISARNQLLGEVVRSYCNSDYWRGFPYQGRTSSRGFSYSVHNSMDIMVHFSTLQAWIQDLLCLGTAYWPTQSEIQLYSSKYFCAACNCWNCYRGSCSRTSHAIWELASMARFGALSILGTASTSTPLAKAMGF